MFKNNPLFFINFLFFSSYRCCFWKAGLCWKHYKNSVSEKHSFSKKQLVKPTFSPMSKNTFFQKKVSFLVSASFCWNHNFYSFSWFALSWAQQIVCTKMRVFSPFLTQIMPQGWFGGESQKHLRRGAPVLDIQSRYRCSYRLMFFSYHKVSPLGITAQAASGGKSRFRDPIAAIVPPIAV